MARFISELPSYYQIESKWTTEAVFYILTANSALFEGSL